MLVIKQELGSKVYIRGGEIKVILEETLPRTSAKFKIIQRDSIRHVTLRPGELEELAEHTFIRLPDKQRRIRESGARVEYEAPKQYSIRKID